MAAVVMVADTGVEVTGAATAAAVVDTVRAAVATVGLTT